MWKDTKLKVHSTIKSCLIKTFKLSRHKIKAWKRSNRNIQRPSIKTLKWFVFFTGAIKRDKIFSRTSKISRPEIDLKNRWRPHWGLNNSPVSLSRAWELARNAKRTESHRCRLALVSRINYAGRKFSIRSIYSESLGGTRGVSIIKKNPLFSNYEQHFLLDGKFRMATVRLN